jgi:hypothetical protein
MTALSGLITLLLTTPALAAPNQAARQSPTPPDVTPPSGALASHAPNAASEALDGLLREWVAWRAFEFPGWGRRLGLPTRADAITSYGLTAEGRRYGQRQVFLAAAEEIDAAALDPRGRLDHALLTAKLRQEVRGYECGAFSAATGSYASARIGEMFRECSLRLDPRAAEDRARYLQRLTWVSQRCADELELLREAKRRGLIGSPMLVQAQLASPITKWLGEGLPIQDDLASLGDSADPAFAELFKTHQERTLPEIRRTLAELEQYVIDILLPACEAAKEGEPSADAKALSAYYGTVGSGSELAPHAIVQRSLDELDRLKPQLDEAAQRTPAFLAAVDVISLSPGQVRVELLKWLKKDEANQPNLTGDAVLAAMDEAWARMAPKVELALGSSLLDRLGVASPSKTNGFQPPSSLAVGRVPSAALIRSLAALDIGRRLNGVPSHSGQSIDNPAWLRSLLRAESSGSTLNGWEAFVATWEVQDENPAKPNPERLAKRARRLVEFLAAFAPATGVWTHERAAELWSEWYGVVPSQALGQVKAISWGAHPGDMSPAIELAIRDLRDSAMRADPSLTEATFFDAFLGEGFLPMSIAERSTLERLEKAKTSAPPSPKK